MKKMLLTLALAASLAVSCSEKCEDMHWVATWATAEQIAEPHNCPPEPGLAGNSFRQIVQISIGGEKARIRLSNEFGTEPVEILAAEVALACSAGSTPDIVDGSSVSLTFADSANVTILPGEFVTSDEFALAMEPRQNVAITLHFGEISASPLTSHPGSRTTSYLAEGNTCDFATAVRTAHWYVINDIEVLAPADAAAIVVLGDSITDGRGSTTNGQDRWTDNFSRRLLANEATAHRSVLNMGLGGNCIIRGGLGPTARSRYARDVFGQEGVKYAILFEGVNDLGGSFDAFEKVDSIIVVYKQIVEEAHARGIKVFGATVTPFCGSFYDHGNHADARLKLNEWILSYEGFDGTLDFSSVMCAADDPNRLNPDFLFENDWLHPNAAGYIHLAESIDLDLFR